MEAANEIIFIVLRHYRCILLYDFDLCLTVFGKRSAPVAVQPVVLHVIVAHVSVVISCKYNFIA